MELKRCPQCRGEAEIYNVRDENYGYWPAQVGVRCKKCKLSRGSFEDQRYDWEKRRHITERKLAEARAANLWNDREVKEWFANG